MSAPFLLMDENRARPARARLFAAPRDWIVAESAGDVPRALRRAEAALREGRYVAGVFAYELGYALEPKLAARMPHDPDGPLLSLGIFDAPEELQGDAIDAWLAREAGAYAVGDLRAAWSEAQYATRFAEVREAIAAGEVYQINLSFPARFAFEGSAAAFYRDLRAKARAGHAAFLRAPERTILSLSPELFLRVEKGRIATRPMKGTVRREPGAAEDRNAAAALVADEKQRAENLMIVDLLRNDLSRVSVPGSVRVDDLFTVETYPTLHTMTSGVSAMLRDGATLSDILRAVFPCGSVTGAPKIRAMELIRALEAGPRGPYCGAIGWFGPKGDAHLNVAIRTIVLNGVEGRMGIGSGVVFDSNAESEYAECLLKARFVTARHEPFALIETMRWSKGEGFHLLARHLARLRESAAFFLFPFDEAPIRAALENAISSLGDGAHRVRLTLDAEGRNAVTHAPLAGWRGMDPGQGLPGRKQAPLRVVISDRTASSSDPHFRHKTTRRALYDGEFERLVLETGCDDVLFLNERGELTEGSRTTLFVERGGALLTPPLACGVLDGVLRSEMIARAAPRVIERVLTPDDLKEADAIYIGNALRGLARGNLVEPSGVEPLTS